MFKTFSVLSIVIAVLLGCTSCFQSIPGEAASYSAEESSAVRTDTGAQDGENTSSDPADKAARDTAGITVIRKYAEVLDRYVYFTTQNHPVIDITPEAGIRRQTVLPDIRETASGGSEQLQTGTFTIPFINISLSVPDNLFLYRIPGQYRDPDGAPVQLAFVDAYVITSKEVTPEQLIEDIRNEAYQKGSGFRSSQPIFDHRNPAYVVTSFRVFHQDYLPIECLYESDLSDSGDYRYSGEYVIAVGKCTLPQARKASGEVFLSAENGSVLLSQEEAPVEEWIRTLREGSVGVDSRCCFYTDGYTSFEKQYSTGEGEDKAWRLTAPLPLFRDGFSVYAESVPGDWAHHTGCYRLVANSDTSVVSDVFWRTYEESLAAMGTDPGKYALPELEIPMTEDGEVYRISDTEDARKLRAYYCAVLRCSAFSGHADVTADRIITAVQMNAEGEPVWKVYLTDPGEPGVLTEIAENTNPFTRAGMDFARTYAENWLTILD